MLWACTALSGVDDLEAENGVAEVPDGATSSSSSSSSGASGSSSSSGDASSSSSSSSSTGGIDAGEDAGKDAGQDAGEDAGKDAGQDAGKPPEPATFRDNFDRASSTTVGNGWVEKTNHFSIQDNQLVVVGSADDGYFNIQCFSPLAGRDVKIEVDVTIPTTSGNEKADPTFVLRAPSDTVTAYNTFDGYAFYLFRDFAGIDREEKPADAKTELTGVAIAPSLEAGVPYHVVLSAIGTNPPKLDMTISDPRKGTVLATLTYLDNDTNKRITAAGRVGLGTSTEGQGVKFDNFVQTVYDGD